VFKYGSGKMSEDKIVENGKIAHSCPKCGEDKNCISFTYGSLQQLLCQECLFDIYGYGHPNRKRDPIGQYELCNKCGTNTMKELMGKSTKQGQYIITKFSCDVCGQSKSTKIKCWKLRDGCETRGVRRNE